MLYTSAELRWFFPGRASPHLLAWFDQSYTQVGFQQRTDYYLSGTGKTLNIKLREGRIEVKQRTWIRPDFNVRRTMKGQMEGWQKWSFDLKENESQVQLAEKYSGNWLAIKKSRRIRTFITELAEITETAPGSYPSRGCNAELTHLEIGKEEWYTLAFEAFGLHADLPGLLYSVSEFILDNDFPLLLSQTDSMGYATWLESGV